MTLKPNSPTPDQEPGRFELRDGEYESAKRNASADPRQVIKVGQPIKRLTAESSDGEYSTKFIELPTNPYLGLDKNSLYSSEDFIVVTKEEEMIRHTDPETFLYLMLLKKMKKNPCANVTKETKHEFLSDEEEDYGQVRAMQYHQIKRDKNTIFRNNGVIQEDSFEFDELKRRRSEYANYCINKITCAIKNQPMDEKEKKKSPLNIQVASKNRRKVKHTLLKEQLSSRYGLAFQENPLATARLANGLSSVKL